MSTSSYGSHGPTCTGNEHLLLLPPFFFIMGMLNKAIIIITIYPKHAFPISPVMWGC